MEHLQEMFKDISEESNENDDLYDRCWDCFDSYWEGCWVESWGDEKMKCAVWDYLWDFYGDD